MENLKDYSDFISATYVIAGASFTVLFAFIVKKYLSVKSKVKNEK